MLASEHSTAFRAPEGMVALAWDRLAAYLRGQGMSLGDRPPRQFGGGMGNLNYLIELDGRPAVLRRPPLGPIPPGANDMKREHRVLSRLWQRFPLAPRGLHYCADAAIIGAPFQIMEYREGQAIFGSKWPDSIAADPALQHHMCALLIRILADLHAVDPAAVGLGEFGRPHGFLGRAVEGWTRRAELACDGEPSAATRAVAAWLAANPVADGAPTLLHNDFKLDNVLFDPGDITRPVAVLDWDQATRGDPLFDLATLLSYWTEPDDPWAMHALDQMPTASAGSLRRAAALTLYHQLTGRDLSDFAFYRVLAMFKLGVVFLQLHAQFRRGTVSDQRYARFLPIAEGIIEFADDVALGRAA